MTPIIGIILVALMLKFLPDLICFLIDFGHKKNTSPVVIPTTSIPTCDMCGSTKDITQKQDWNSLPASMAEAFTGKYTKLCKSCAHNLGLTIMIGG